MNENTDALVALGGGAEASPISTHYYWSVEDACEAIGAADLLGLGIRLLSRSVPADRHGERTLEWVMELFAEPHEEPPEAEEP